MAGRASQGSQQRSTASGSWACAATGCPRVRRNKSFQGVGGAAQLDEAREAVLLDNARSRQRLDLRQSPLDVEGREQLLVLMCP